MTKLANQEKLGSVLASQDELNHQIKAASFKIAVEKWKVIIDVASQSSKLLHGVWLTNIDGTYTHIQSGDFGSTIRISQANKVVSNFNFALDGHGEHYVFFLNGEHTDINKIESYDTMKMRQNGHTEGYIHGSHSNFVYLSEDSQITERIKQGFPVDELIFLVDKVGVPKGDDQIPQIVN